ncbi:unnamed protein product [Pedinophyceae sp. YPF-701]|nr:unnamed protein product [Pedinophyceae sp. YPF-701]
MAMRCSATVITPRGGLLGLRARSRLGAPVQAHRRAARCAAQVVVRETELGSIILCPYEDEITYDDAPAEPAEKPAEKPAPEAAKKAPAPLARLFSKIARDNPEEDDIKHILEEETEMKRPEAAEPAKELPTPAAAVEAPKEPVLAAAAAAPATEPRIEAAVAAAPTTVPEAAAAPAAVAAAPEPCAATPAPGAGVPLRYVPPSEPVREAGAVRQYLTAPGNIPVAALATAAAAAVAAMDSGMLPCPSNFTGNAVPLLGLSAAISALLSATGVPVLRKLGAVQPIRTDGPASHIADKKNTVTLGGLTFLPVALVLGLAAASGPAAAFCATCAAAFGAVGLLDDAVAIRSGKGLRMSQKFALQIAVSSGLCVLAAKVMLPKLAGGAVIALGGSASVALGPVLYWLLAGSAMVALPNGTNLTDGLDGLLAGTAAIACIGAATSLVVTAPAIAPLLIAAAGSCLGFLAVNRKPAQVFMGNVGSMALGGLLAGATVVSGSYLAMLLLCLVPALEAASVVAQLGSMKLRKGKRVLRMAPLHHHYELGGVKEVPLVSWAWAASGVAAMCAVMLVANQPVTLA